MRVRLWLRQGIQIVCTPWLRRSHALDHAVRGGIVFTKLSTFELCKLSLLLAPIDKLFVACFATHQHTPKVAHLTATPHTRTHVVSEKSALRYAHPAHPATRLPCSSTGCVVPKSRTDFNSPDPPSRRHVTHASTPTSRPRRGAHAPSPVEPVTRARHHVTRANPHLRSFRFHRARGGARNCSSLQRVTDVTQQAIRTACVSLSAWAHTIGRIWLSESKRACCRQSSSVCCPCASYCSEMLALRTLPCALPCMHVTTWRR
jgi:hypothetical protein